MTAFIHNITVLQINHHTFFSDSQNLLEPQSSGFFLWKEEPLQLFREAQDIISGVSQISRENLFRYTF